MNGYLESAWLILRLPLAPRRLVRTAMQVNTISALLTSALSLTLILILPIAIAFAAAGEPLPNLRVYLSLLYGVLVIFGSGLLLFLIAFLSFVAMLEGGWDPKRQHHPDVAAVRAIFLAPVVSLPLFLIWSVGFMANHLSAPGITIRGIPNTSWLRHPAPIAVGSCVYFPLLAFLTIVLAVWAVRQIRRLLADNTCANCGYSLQFLTSDRCPECGEPTTDQRHEAPAP